MLVKFTLVVSLVLILTSCGDTAVVRKSYPVVLDNRPAVNDVQDGIVRSSLPSQERIVVKKQGKVMKDVLIKDEVDHYKVVITNDTGSETTKKLRKTDKDTLRRDIESIMQEADQPSK